MPHNLYDWLGRVKRVELEYLATRSVADEYKRVVIDAGGREHLCRPAYFAIAYDRLEGTYVMRLWAEFETAVRSYYRDLINDPHNRIATLSLIDAVAGVRRGRAIADEVRKDVHRVRDYRNALVHERDNPVEAIKIATARGFLTTYLCKLPAKWG